MLFWRIKAANIVDLDVKDDFASNKCIYLNLICSVGPFLFAYGRCHEENRADDRGDLLCYVCS